MANLVLDPEEKKMVQADFASWMEIQDRRKELTVENKDIVENSARVLNTKTAVIGKLFKVMKKQMEEGENELEDLYNLFEEVSS